MIKVTVSTYVPLWLSLLVTTAVASHHRHVEVPSPLIVGYASWNECDKKIIHAVEQGVNVVMWFAINLALNSSTGLPAVTGGPDMDCVAYVVRSLDELGLDTLHMVSVGGWDAPHPDTTNTAEATYEYWDYWNRNIAARPDKGFYGFDGIDWDIEGNDDFSSPYNHFTVECLDLMGRFSQLAKEKGSYIVSMVPAESYLDPTRSRFDRSLLHQYEEWIPTVPGFHYHGLNTYAYLIDRYGTYGSSSSSALDGSSSMLSETFDFITIQLYEGYSHAEYNTTQLSVASLNVTQNQLASDYITDFVRSVAKGWMIDYSRDVALQYPRQSRMSIPSSRIVIGLANGWAGDGKFFLAYPDQLHLAYQALSDADLQPRGFAFWDILDEGKCSPLKPSEPVWMAAGLNRFLHVRNSSVELKLMGCSH